MARLEAERFYEIVVREEESEQMKHRKRLRELFWDIVERWTTEADIDYSISLDEIIEMVSLSPDFFVEKMGMSEIKGEFIENLCLAKRVPSKRRVL